MISKDKALKIAKRHYERARRRYTSELDSYQIEQGFPSTGAPYLMKKKYESDKVWCVYCPSDHLWLDRDRVIIIAKDTGKILFDGVIAGG